MIDRFEVHCHTDLSNKGSDFSSSLDSINTVPTIISRALEVGLKGIAITDHESLSSHPKVLKYIRDHDIDLKVGLGDEIYLVNERSRKKQIYYHLIVIPKDEIGYRGLKEMSSHALLRMFKEHGGRIFRTPVIKSEFEDIMTRFKGHFIVSTACLGGELATCILNERSSREKGDFEDAKRWGQQMHDFIMWMKKLMGDDFYFEVAPSRYEDQLYFNKVIQKIAAHYNVKIVLGTDAHYGKKEEFPIQEAFLRSNDKKGKEREVAEFYRYAYLQSEEEIIENLQGTGLNYEDLCKTSIEIMNKIQSYSIFKKQKIPKENVKNYPKESYVKWNNFYKLDQYEHIKKAFLDDDLQIRYYINQNFEGLEKKGKITEERIARINEEVDIFYTISEKLEDCVFAYPNTLQFYIDKFWEWGSIVGPGRGSACSWTGNYALGITQVDPMEYGLYHWRFLNKERPELPRRICQSWGVVKKGSEPLLRGCERLAC